MFYAVEYKLNGQPQTNNVLVSVNIGETPESSRNSFPIENWSCKYKLYNNLCKLL